jgi:hypothetical protein
MLATIQFKHFLFNLLSKNIQIKSLVLPVVLCMYEALAVILRKEHRLRMFENSVLGEYLYICTINDFSYVYKR